MYNDKKQIRFFSSYSSVVGPTGCCPASGPLWNSSDHHIGTSESKAKVVANYERLSRFCPFGYQKLNEDKSIKEAKLFYKSVNEAHPNHLLCK